MNVVLYLRYSSDKQNEQSIEGQRRICEEFCKREDLKVVESYIDRAQSASKDIKKRSDFQRMIADSEKRKWEAVIVYKLDRFARNRFDSATYKARLRKNGVKVISATEGISENPEGIILESVLEGMAEFYSKELSQKVTRGMHETALKCNSTGGSIPLGYKVEGKKLVTDILTAPIVKQAFELYASGCTVAEICNRFNAAGYRTAKGTQFRATSFKSMFKNERYIGTYTYKDIRIAGGMPAIVDKNTFESVQKRLKTNALSPARGKATVDYLLTMKLFCGYCGSRMVGESGVGKQGISYHYYTCMGRRKQHICNKKPIPKDALEYQVASFANEILTSDNIEKLADMAIAQANADLKNDQQLPALQSELKDAEKRLNNLVELIELGSGSQTISERITELEGIKKDLQSQIEQAMEDHVILDKEQIIWWLSKFLNGDVDSPDFRRRVIDLLINSVTVWDDEDGGGYKFTVVFNLVKDNTRTYRVSDLGSHGSPSSNRSTEPFWLGTAVFFFSPNGDLTTF